MIKTVTDQLETMIVWGQELEDCNATIFLRKVFLKKAGKRVSNELNVIIYI